MFDEIAAIPICFLGWVIVQMRHTGAFPTPEYFFSTKHLLSTIGVFAAFRFFDVLKPPPVRQSQSFHGGLGVTMDDILAAVYVNVLVAFGYGGSMLLR